MITGIYQNCYTNHCREIDGQLVSGWQSLATSPDIPEELLKKCSSFQVASSQITESPKNENGEILTLTELMGDGRAFYFIRTKFGLQDRMGRANMFSHAYVFPAEEILKNPNRLCGFALENFKENKEDAETPAECLFTEPETALTAMARLRMSEDSLRKFIRAVYFQATDNRKKDETLYVQYDGSYDSLRALFYLLFLTLPFRVLCNLKIGTHGTVGTVGKNLVFSGKAKQMPCFFIPETGENNVLTERAEKRIARLLFVDRPVELIGDEKKSIEFREKITERAKTLGDLSGNSELTMKLAMEMEENADVTVLSEQDLMLRFSDALRTPTYGNEAADRYIAGLFAEIAARGLNLTEQNEDDLYMRLPESKVPEFKETIRAYLTKKLENLSFDGAVLEFGALSPMNRLAVLPVYEKDETKKDVPDRYYADKYWETEDVTYESLLTFLEQIHPLKNREESEDTLERKATDLLLTDFRKARRPEKSADSFLGLMKKAFPARNSAETERKVRELFWQKMTYLRYNELTPESLIAFAGTDTEEENRFKTYGNLRTLLKEKQYEQFFDAFSALSTDTRENNQGSGESLRKALFQGLEEAEDWYLARTKPKEKEKKGFFSFFKKK